MVQSDYSRDETEFGSFGDAYVSRSFTALPTFGGLFDSVLKVVKKPVQAKVSAGLTAQGATPAQVAAYNKAAAKAQPTAKDIASGAVKSAVLLAPIVATAGGAALVAPALLAAAPVVKSIAPIASAAKPAVSSALQFADDARGTLKAALPTGSVNPALIAAAAARGEISTDSAKKMIAGLNATTAAAPAKPAVPVATAPAQPAAMTPGALAMFSDTLSSMIRTQKTAAISEKVQKMLETAAAKMPATAESKAAIAAAQTKLDNARRTAGLPVPLSPLATALAGRAPIAGNAFNFVPSTPLVAARPLPVPSIVQINASSPAVAAAAAKLKAADAELKAAVRYLVLDSGQVLSDAAAQQKLPGFVVRGDGSVARQ